MRQPTSSTSTGVILGWSAYCGVSFFLPLLTLYALYLVGEYYAKLRLLPTPDFWSQNLLTANLACYAPLLLLLSVVGNIKLYCPQFALNVFSQRFTAGIAWFTLALVIAANTLALTLHFSVFSADRYIRCWEPYPWGTWYYARAPEQCEQHRLAPVQMLKSHSSAENA